MDSMNVYSVRLLKDQHERQRLGAFSKPIVHKIVDQDKSDACSDMQ
jgi:hypothetical protein